MRPWKRLVEEYPLTVYQAWSVLNLAANVVGCRPPSPEVDLLARAALDFAQAEGLDPYYGAVSYLRLEACGGSCGSTPSVCGCWPRPPRRLPSALRAYVALVAFFALLMYFLFVRPLP